MNVSQKDKKYLGRDGGAYPLTVAKTKGSYVFDEKGKRYIDFYMGWCVGNLGWSVKEIVCKIKNFSGPTYVAPKYQYKGWAELAELLATLAPGNLSKSFRATGGTEAVEIALQAAMAHTKHHKFISIEGSYHGHSIAAMSIGSSYFRKRYKNLLPDCYKVELPLDEKAAHKVEKLLSRRDIAAFIMEPIICNLGAVVPDKKFFDIMQATCKKYGTLFIADEVATGFGRTGKMFACEHFNLKPDILCLAKGVSGGSGALGATLMTPKVAKSFEFDFSFYSTYGWHPFNVEATLASLRYFIKNRKEIFSNATILSNYFEIRLNKMKFKYPAKIKVIGLAIGVHFSRHDYPNSIIKNCLKRGLLIASATSNDFVLYPALTMSMKTAEEGLDILELCI